ncbi:MAG: hypothetical protein JWM36_141 [Hyphomicrobiales bacterium]|nr:hypothetical protein [Hyphomicrobiales bacterium]
MQIIQSRYTRKRLSALSKQKLVSYVLAGQLSNELGMLSNNLLASQNTLKNSTFTPEEHAAITQIVFYLKLLAGKLHEGGRFIIGHVAPLVIGKHKSAPESIRQEYIKLCKIKNGAASKFARLRKEFAFHIDGNPIIENVEKLDEDETLFDYISLENSSNNLFFSSEVISFHALLGVTPEGTQDAIIKLIDEVMSNVVAYKAFLSSHRIWIETEFLGDNYELEPFERQNAPKRVGSFMPFFHEVD